jgi:site-specific DNA-methyltransferase (adenine-specific)
MTLEKNRIYNMDCLEGMKEIKTGSVKLIVADPPYFMGMTHNGQKGGFVDLAICKPFFIDLFKEFKRVLNPDGEVYFFCDWRGYAFYYPLFDAYLGARNMIVWDKISGAGNQWAFCHELMIWTCSRPNLHKNGTNIWRSKAFTSGAQVTNGTKVHPTQKPLELIEKMIRESSGQGDLVVDPFSGSGTTGIAARKLGRDFLGFELDIENFDIIKKRVALNLTGTLFAEL